MDGTELSMRNRFLRTEQAKALKKMEEEALEEANMASKESSKAKGQGGELGNGRHSEEDSALGSDVRETQRQSALSSGAVVVESDSETSKEDEIAGRADESAADRGMSVDV